MNAVFRVIRESILMAFQQLVSNRLRSFLSLLGISIGIFCIIGVHSAVDSLENNVRGSFDKLGNDVIYIQKFTWGDPGPNWMRYLRRPNVDFEDFEVVKEKVKLAQELAYIVGLGNKTVKFNSNSVENVDYQAVTYEFGEMFNYELSSGRYFSQAEYRFGAAKVLLGADVAEGLFANIDPVGKTVKIGGRNLEVIGVFKKEGESLVNIFNNDLAAVISYECAKKVANLKPDHPFGNSSICIKANDGVPVEELKYEVKGIMRAHRKLKPKQEDDFSLNTLSIVASALDGFFGVLNLLGIIIGGFAIFVGMFSVANIMFVSVKERTGMIGIKKALGAKSYFILLEFLIESIILCILGGLAGLMLIQVVVKILSKLIEFELFLSVENILLGVGLSIIVGILAGMIPASLAARMDPVEAMRK